MIDDSLLPFSLPSVDRKKITAAFDGGRISSDGGVMLLALAERRMGIADKLAAEITDRREPTNAHDAKQVAHEHDRVASPEAQLRRMADCRR